MGRWKVGLEGRVFMFMFGIVVRLRFGFGRRVIVKN